MQTAHDKEFLVTHLAKLALQLGAFPTSVDLRLEKRTNPEFPSHNTFYNMGSKSTQVALVREFAKHNPAYIDVLKFLPEAETDTHDDQAAGVDSKTKEGFVYLGLLKMDNKKRYKIGKTNLVERRSTELSLQLPEKLELVHSMKTDDMDGIENYWHKRFANKRTNGEWFNLSTEDVRTFKLRKFM